MARNGSGTYNRIAGTPYVYNTIIDQVVVNSEMDDIATALTASIAKDGQTTPTANLPMGTYKHTGVGAATTTTDYARADQAQNSSMEYLSSVAGTDTITATATPIPAAYAAGQTFRFVPANNNTGAATINISSLGAKSITKNGTTALGANDLVANKVAIITYDGTQFQLANPAGGTGDFLADGSVPMTGSLTLGGAGTGIIFEGTTADAYETTLVAGEPTADRTITLPNATDTLVGKATTDTLTNKRITARTGSTTSSATPTINTDNVDVYQLTAQAADITSFTTNLSGTPTDGQGLIIEITGTAARAITWGASFEASTVALPTTTVSTDKLTVGFLWNSATSKWRCIGKA